MTAADFGSVIYPWIVAGLGGFVGAAVFYLPSLAKRFSSYRLGKALEGFKAALQQEGADLRDDIGVRAISLEIQILIHSVAPNSSPK